MTLQPDVGRAASPFGGRRVVVFGLDGTRADALKQQVESGNAPHIAGLIENGAVTWNAVAGGRIGETLQATSSGPGWASILTGVWADKHGVFDNSFNGSNFANYPHFFKRLHEVEMTVEMASLVSWGPIQTEIVEDSGVSPICDCHAFTSGSYDQRDADLTTETVSILQSGDPDVVFHYQGNPDIAGHTWGFSPEVPEYMAAITTADARIGQVLAAVEARPNFAAENWLFIVTSDHGGIGKGHGGQTPEERTIPFIISGGEVPSGVKSMLDVGQPAVAAGVFRHLGLNIPSAWGWEEDSFAIGAELRAAAGSDAVFLSWSLPPSGLAGLTGFELRRDGSLLAALDDDARSWVDTTGSTAGATLEYTLTPLGTGEADLRAEVVGSGSGPELADPVLHLSFDGDLTDSSGNGLDATAVGTPVFEAGVEGQALRLNATDGAELGDVSNGVPELLRFGADTDFSIEFWIRCDGGWSGDPAILSNKAWVSGGNPGWIIAAENNGNDWQWNFKGDLAGRLDFDPQNAGIADGEWHRVVVTHDRDGVASFYHDGESIGSVPIAGAGNVDTSYPLRLGRDGAGQYPFSVPASIDELKIWRRVLSPSEVGLAPSSTAFDAWMAERAYLYGDPGPGELEALADPDRDGWVNLLEFAGGSHPFVPSSSPRLDIHAGADGLPWLSFLQRNGGRGRHGDDPAYEVDGIRYQVMTSADLGGPWLPAAVTQLDADSSAGPAASDCHRIVLALPDHEPRQFWRLEVSLIAP